MAIAKGIAHLGNNAAQHAGVIVDQPKADGVKHMSQHARLREQIDPACQLDFVRGQHGADPCRADASLHHAAMIAVV